MVIRGFSFTAAINDQSASPLYICARVRPWMLMALMPTSCKRSATSTMYLELSSQPKRVFTVTGKLHVSTISLVIDTILGMSCRMPAPAPRHATFFTGQP